MSNSYSARNEAELDHLKRLAGSLMDEQMGRPAGGPGWTVGGILGHLAFWDQRAVGLLRRWKSGGIGPSAVDVDAVNDAMRPLLNAIAPRVVAQLAISSAQDIDRWINSLDASMLAKVEAEGKPVRLDRAAHRAHHLEQIEKAIG